MKSLKQLLEASLLDIDTNLDVTDEEVIRSAITKFINDNYYTREFTISDKPNKDGKYEVSSKYRVTAKNTNLTSLTNDLFVWSVVLGNFYCDYCDSLQSLEGAPNKVGDGFYCFNCSSLKSLKGAPEEVRGDFCCNNCDSLTNLEGAPKEVGTNFYCNYCDSLTNLKGSPKNVGGSFYCNNCKSLTTLKGAPEKVGSNFCCYTCKVEFEESDVKKVSNVKGKIYV